MTELLLGYLCDPITKEGLELVSPVHDANGNIVSGGLKNRDGKIYTIVNGIPRFADSELQKSVDAFGDQWNYFNFDAFKIHWLNHTVKNTFGSSDIFKEQIVIDAGGGSGMQTLWMLESGAKHVIMLDLSHSVDDVVQRNLSRSGYTNFDVVQCSIDCPPIKPDSVEGIVICHNVIQHTPSVEKTAKALFGIVKPGSEFVFNCYRRNDRNITKKVCFASYSAIRNFLCTKSFQFRLNYSKMVALLRFIPIIGTLLEKINVCIRGDVPRGSVKYINYITQLYKSAVLNTFDYYGAHEYQHLKTDIEIDALLKELQPDRSKILNTDKYYSYPQPIGCALRVYK